MNYMLNGKAIIIHLIGRIHSWIDKKRHSINQ